MMKVNIYRAFILDQVKVLDVRTRTQLVTFLRLFLFVKYSMSVSGWWTTDFHSYLRPGLLPSLGSAILPVYKVSVEGASRGRG